MCFFCITSVILRAHVPLQIDYILGTYYIFVLLNEFLLAYSCFTGLPRWLSGKEPACQGMRPRRHRFDPWAKKIPWRREWQPTPVFLPGQPHGQRNLARYSPQSRKRVRHAFVTKQQQLLYNVVLVSTQQFRFAYSKVNQLYVYIYPLFLWISFPFRSPQSLEQSFLDYTVGSHQLSVLYIAVYICQPQSPSSSHPSCPTLVSICLFSTSVSLSLPCK